MSEEIRPGDKFEWLPHKLVRTAKARVGSVLSSGPDEQAWTIEEDVLVCILSDTRYFRRLPREPEPLRVGGTCFELERLRAGTSVYWCDGVPLNSFLVDKCVELSFFRSLVQRIGVVILALPEAAKPEWPEWPLLEIPAKPPFHEALVPAAPSLDDAVPVGSRWEWKTKVYLACGSTTSIGNEFMIRADGRGMYCGLNVGGFSGATRAEILQHATRIDEPTKAEQMADAYDRRAAAVLDERRTPPPARCAPGCEPAKPCRRMALAEGFECPVFAEERAWACNETLRKCSLPTRLTDQLEAQQWRNRQHEPTTSGMGGMIGRYRFNRRPR